MTFQYDIIVNRRSRQVLKTGVAAIEAKLRLSFGSKLHDIIFAEPRDLTQAIRHVLHDAADHPGRALVIGGGDGSLLAAADIVSGEISLGLLPLGTNNLVARALGFSSDLTVAAAQLQNSIAQKIDVGCVNGRYFLYGLLLDSSAVRYFKARENIRDAEYAAFAKNAALCVAHFLLARQTVLTISGIRMSGRLFAVTNNAISPRTVLAGEGNWIDRLSSLFAKTCLDGGELVFYAAEGGMWKTPATLWAVFTRRWHKSPLLKSYRGVRLVITREISGMSLTDIVIDGEIRQTQFPLHIDLLPARLTLLRPPK